MGFRGHVHKNCDNKKHDTNKTTDQPHPFTAEWVLQQVITEPMERALMTVKHRVSSRKREVQESTIKELKAAEQGVVVRALREFKQNKGHVRGTKGRSFIINSGIITRE